jgi:hypothetical protein
MNKKINNDQFKNAMTKNKFKSWASLGSIFLLTITANAQSIAIQSVNSSGAKMIQANGSLSFTVGELVVLSQTDSEGNTLGSGFTTASTLSTSSLQETDKLVLDVKIYPNPTNELVNIQINYSTIEQVLVSISDLQGKEIFNGKYAGVSNVIGINTINYSAGTYTLSLKNSENQLLGSYKIIKN